MNETHFFAAEDTDEDEEGEGEEDADLGATSDTEPNSEPDSVDNEDAEDEEGDNYNLNGTNYWVSVSHIHFIVQSISCLGHVRVLFLPPAIIDIWSFLEEKIKKRQVESFELTKWCYQGQKSKMPNNKNNINLH